MNKVLSIAKNIIIGAVKGGASPVTSILTEVKKFTKGGAFKFLDVNGDGKVDLQDIQALQWQTLGKLAALGGLIYAAIKLDILQYIL